LMATIEEIVEMEQTYKNQIVAIRDTVLRYAKEKGWSPQSRGRRPHVSIYGPVNGLKGVMDIAMTENNWEKMPKSLQPDTEFVLWCSASVTRDGRRLAADTELFWTVPFSALPETVERFIAEAWEMLSGLNDGNLLKEFSGRSVDPDGPPEFGPPRKRVRRT
jgi:hypothetical protein